jgi:multicomponent Na+:H+ antiporter subunit D
MSAETLLIVALALPWVGALLIGLVGRNPNLRETVTLLTSVGLLAAVASIGVYVYGGARPELSLGEMVPGLGLNFAIEPLGMLFAMVASLLWPVNSIYSIGYMRGLKEKHQTRFYICFALAIGGVIGVAFAGNLLTLFIFYELITLSTYPLVTHKGTEAAMKAGRTYLGILLTTSIGFFLVAIIWTWNVAGTLDFVPGGILEGRIGTTAAGLLLMLFVFGIGKAAIMPVHRWLPAAMVAPTPVSALLHAVAVVKAGVFTILKVVLYTFGTGFLVTVPSERFLLYLAGFTVVAASVVALQQTEFKRLLAYSTIGQLSYIILAALALTPLSEIGAAIHIAGHAFGKITLFFTAGAIYVASKKTMVTEFRGIGRRMPITMVAFTIGALSMIGVPPTAGFVSKWYIIAGAFQNDNYFVLGVLVLSTGLNAAYFLPIVFRAFIKPEDVKPPKDHGEAPWPMVLALSITATLTLLFFIFNGPVVQFEYGILQEGVVP